MARVIKRPVGMMRPEAAIASPWHRAFGSVDARAVCDCCGSGLTRYAVLADGGLVLGVSCAVSAGVIEKPPSRETKPWVYKPMSNHVAWMSREPAAWAAACTVDGGTIDQRAEAWRNAGGHPRMASAMGQVAYMLAEHG